MKIILRLFKILLQAIYAPLKVFPTNKNKILFLSRQSNECTLDFKMLQDELLKKDPALEIVSICKRSSDSKLDIIPYGIAFLRSMYHLATASVCVLDSYWPAACILKHKPELTIIQIWHALGKIKQSGYQTLGKSGGRGRLVADELCMHRNYDYIIAGGESWNPFYCASFDTTEDKLLNYGLPRIDYLLATEEDNRERIYKLYPEFKNKTVLLYAPTFRRGIEFNWQQLRDCYDPSRFILVVKGHPNQPISSDSSDVYTCDEFKSTELLSVCDYLITDYSAIAVEGAILNRKTLYYVFDYDEYNSTNGTNINLFDEMPGCVFRDAESLIQSLDAPYRQDSLDNCRKKFLPAELGTSTEKITELIISMRGKK